MVARPFVIIKARILGGKIGAFTATRNEFVALKGGAPSSTTRVVMTFVVDP